MLAYVVFVTVLLTFLASIWGRRHTADKVYKAVMWALALWGFVTILRELGGLTTILVNLGIL